MSRRAARRLIRRPACGMCRRHMPNLPAVARAISAASPARRPRVIVRMRGGLGNQLFQYAAGTHVARMYGATLALDLGEYRHPGRRYMLDAYAINAEICHARALISRHRGVAILYPDPVGRNPWRWLRPRRVPLISEAGESVDARALAPPAQVYLHGYWQSEKYFADVAEILRRELRPVAAPDGANQAWLDAMASSRAVAVSVRRGDYLLPQVRAVHGVCTLDYYRAAFAAIRARVDRPTFFVFSDDMAWCRENFKGDEFRFVDVNGIDAAVADLHLISTCRHHVIANSSFSWWGAWLARHPDQQVIAPHPWYADGRATPDLLPPQWRTVPIGL